MYTQLGSFPGGADSPIRSLSLSLSRFIPLSMEMQLTASATRSSDAFVQVGALVLQLLPVANRDVHAYAYARTGGRKKNPQKQ